MHKNMSLRSYCKDLFTHYTTTRLVKVRSPWLAMLYIGLVILAWAAFLGSLHLDIHTLYQTPCSVRGVVTSKVKGFVSTENLTDQELVVANPELYRRVFDPADIVYPSHGGEGETGSFTIVTNMVITPDQKLGTCPEESGLADCTSDSDCTPGHWTVNTHGILTGQCNQSTNTCLLIGWCPIEQDNVLPMNGKRPLLEGVENFTVFLKTTVEFPGCTTRAHNHLSSLSKSEVESCNYHHKDDPLCPIFKIGDIVKWSDHDFAAVAVKGGIFRIKVIFDCDFDFGRTTEDCLPKHEFVRVDDHEAGESKGWNFRSAEFFSADRRILMKQFALKILINVEGGGRKFDFFRMILALGATRGLFSLVHLACDFVLDTFYKGTPRLDRTAATTVESDNTTDVNDSNSEAEGGPRLPESSALVMEQESSKA